ncbi:MAG: hypothetical protein KJP00_10230 [Bacteroidia bacterium]|nr:hypothetical protein [Bacteroidia bacterium]
MKERNIIQEIQQASKEARVNPSRTVWDRLAQQLDEVPQGSSRPIFKFHPLSIAATVIILIGAAAFIFLQRVEPNDMHAVKLEDLHSLEINPENNLPNAGDAITIPALLDVKAVFTSDKIIEEGSSEQKLVPRKDSENYGLG